MQCNAIKLTTAYTDLNVTASNRILPKRVCRMNMNSEKRVYKTNVIFSCDYDT